MESNQPSGANGIKDAIVTLPAWGIFLIGLLCISSLLTALWLLAFSKEDNLKGNAIQLLIVLIPLTSAVIAAIAIRRTSTRQIDRLVTGFLEETVLERFKSWAHPLQRNGLSDFIYPFSDVKLVSPTQNRSYAYFSFRWREMPQHEAIVGIKTNVFNFEIFARISIETPNTININSAHENILITKENISTISNHPILSRFIGIIQGSASEGYEIKIEFGKPEIKEQCTNISMHISLRQKLRENFLASPFLKRYFAEDAAIAIGVLFSEWQKSSFWPKSTYPLPSNVEHPNE